jgi:hypothetical protein
MQSVIAQQETKMSYYPTMHTMSVTNDEQAKHARDAGEIFCKTAKPFSSRRNAVKIMRAALKNNPIVTRVGAHRYP